MVRNVTVKTVVKRVTCITFWKYCCILRKIYRAHKTERNRRNADGKLKSESKGPLPRCCYYLDEFLLAVEAIVPCQRASIF